MGGRIKTNRKKNGGNKQEEQEFRVWGLGFSCRSSNLGFRVFVRLQELGFRVCGFFFDLGFRVVGSGLEPQLQPEIKMRRSSAWLILPSRGVAAAAAAATAAKSLAGAKVQRQRRRLRHWQRQRQRLRKQPWPRTQLSSRIALLAGSWRNSIRRHKRKLV